MSRIVHDLIAELRLGRIRTVAFVVRGDVRWTLPLYELAIATARRGWSMGIADARYWFVTPEPVPLAGFGSAARAAVSARLEPEGITFVGSTFADLRPGAVLLDPQGECIEVDRVVTLGESARITAIDSTGGSPPRRRRARPHKLHPILGDTRGDTIVSARRASSRARAKLPGSHAELVRVSQAEMKVPICRHFSCRRRDSKPRHADYDLASSVALGSVACFQCR